MKLTTLSRISCAMAFLAMAAAVQAGSDRWIMHTSVSDMQDRNLVHVRLAEADGVPVESDGLKQMVVLSGGCEQGAALTVARDYKMGFYPEGKAIGLFMMSGSWQARPLCFSLPGKGAVSAQIPHGSAGESLLLTLVPAGSTDRLTSAPR